MEEVAGIGKDATAEALKIATEEGHVEAPKDVQETPEGEEEIPDNTIGPIMEVEEKAPLRVMLQT